VVALHAQRSETGIGDCGAFRQRDDWRRAQLLRVGRIMGIMTGGAGYGLVSGVGVRLDTRPDEIRKTAGRVAANTSFTPGPRGRARCNRMPGTAPFGVFDLVFGLCGHVVVALGAAARDVTHRDGGFGLSVGRRAAKNPEGVFAARSVTALALDIGKGLQSRRRCRPVASSQVRGEYPIQTRSDIIKSVVHGICIVANRVTKNAALGVVVTLQTINGLGENTGMCGLQPCPVFVWREQAAAVTEGAGVDPQVCGGGDCLGDVGVPAVASPDSDRHSVLPRDVRAKHRASRRASHFVLCRASRTDTIGFIERRDVRSQRAGVQYCCGPDRFGGQNPSDIGDVRVGNCVIHQRLQISRRAYADRGQSACTLCVGQCESIHLGGRQRTQFNLTLQCGPGCLSCCGDASRNQDNDSQTEGRMFDGRGIFHNRVLYVLVLRLNTACNDTKELPKCCYAPVANCKP